MSDDIDDLLSKAKDETPKQEKYDKIAEKIRIFASSLHEECGLDCVQVFASKQGVGIDTHKFEYGVGNVYGIYGLVKLFTKTVEQTISQGIAIITNNEPDNED